MLERVGPREVTECWVIVERQRFHVVMAAVRFRPWSRSMVMFVRNIMTVIAEPMTGDVSPGVTCPSIQMQRALWSIGRTAG